MHKIYNTRHWSYERIKLYSSELTSAFKKLQEHFPGDINMWELAQEIAIGVQDLWLILDYEDRFCAFLTTQLNYNLRGKKRLTLCQLAGIGGIKLADLLAQLEIYAKQNNVEEICAIGRMGWEKQLKNYGYKPEIFKYRKEL